MTSESGSASDGSATEGPLEVNEVKVISFITTYRPIVLLLIAYYTVAIQIINNQREALLS
ncbi:hypothetical protein [Fulvivirga sediminis]|uniref:Uncharacterized protein n=1 Tax=Fulvivirga sediminis TaxID=2803949 RepID=A0A937F7I5_9BACT|nr:hypothetical protein [Fulvivirga sediminis]MBL3657170.1 hypothetical protein [Fulvivirga sediminis]